MKFNMGPGLITQYRRGNYEPWYAIGEFVDNSTQSYQLHREELDMSYSLRGIAKLEVSIAYDKEQGFIRIADNAMGMNEDELTKALDLGRRPDHDAWRSRYGVGMKAAAFWFGDVWTIRTKRLGDTTELEVTLDVEAIANGEDDFPLTKKEDLPAEDSYTVVEIRSLNQTPHGRTLGAMKEFLRSMYRVDLRESRMDLIWRGEQLIWQDEDLFAKSKDGNEFKKSFEFEVDGKHVSGWVGVLLKGSGKKGGFSILHADRVVRGYPNHWRPKGIFGEQEGGSNNLVVQRLVGELFMDDFEVTNTKDGILWQHDELDQVEDALELICKDYKDFAQNQYRPSEGRSKSSDLEVATATDAFQNELESTEFVDAINFAVVPPEDVVAADNQALLSEFNDSESDLKAIIQIGGRDTQVLVFIADNESANDPYVLVEATQPEKIVVVINSRHPHMLGIGGADNLLNYFRQCTYDAIAEWQARNQVGRLEPQTIRLLKDKLLRLGFVLSQK